MIFRDMLGVCMMAIGTALSIYSLIISEFKLAIMGMLLLFGGIMMIKGEDITEDDINSEELNSIESKGRK